MYIKRKVYSLGYDETTGEERLFSTTEIISEEAYCEKLYAEAEKKEKGKRKSLKTVESNKGLKRAVLLSPIDGGGGLVGGYISKSEADKADEEGATNEEILRRAKDRGLKVGAATGATTGLVAGIYGAKSSHGKSLALPIIGAATGALGGRNAASVNTKDRILKRSLKEED